MLTFEEVKAKYKGVHIKKLKNGENYSMGYRQDNQTQAIFKSELRFARIGTYINGGLFVLNKSTMQALKLHQQDNSNPLPEEITYSEERYIIPLRLFDQAKGTEVSKPVNIIDSTSSLFDWSTNYKNYDFPEIINEEDVLNKAKKIITDNKVLESLSFFKNIFSQQIVTTEENQSLLTISLKAQIESLGYSYTEEKVLNAIVSLVIFNEINK